MKIYLSIPHKNREEFGYFIDAVKQLEKEGHKIYDIYDDEPYPQPDKVEYHVDKFKESEKALKQADMIIIEATYPGRRQGYEIARGLDERKVVLSLYSEEKGTISTPSLMGNTSKYFSFEAYTKDNIEKLLKDAIQDAKTKLDTKFILIISPEIDRYISWASDQRRLHKAQIVRSAVESMMEEDKEYQEYLENRFS